MILRLKVDLCYGSKIVPGATIFQIRLLFGKGTPFDNLLHWGNVFDERGEVYSDWKKCDEEGIIVYCYFGIYCNVLG